MPSDRSTALAPQRRRAGSRGRGPTSRRCISDHSWRVVHASADSRVVIERCGRCFRSRRRATNEAIGAALQWAQSEKRRLALRREQLARQLRREAARGRLQDRSRIDAIAASIREVDARTARLNALMARPPANYYIVYVMVTALFVIVIGGLYAS